MLPLKQQFILALLCHKSTTTCQIDSNKISNSKSEPDLCNCIKWETIEATAPPQLARKQGKIFGTNCNSILDS